MVHQLEVHGHHLVEGQEVAHDGDDVGDVHDQDGVAALQLPSLLRAVLHDDPEVAHRDEAAEDAEEAVQHVHDEAHELVEGLQGGHAEVHVVGVVLHQPHVLLVRQVPSFLDPRDDQTSCVPDGHVDSVEYEVRQDPLKLDPEEGLEDADHPRDGHHGGRDLGDAAEGAAEELRDLVNEGVLKLDPAQEHVGHEQGGYQVG